jgi:hypothetical protein
LALAAENAVLSQRKIGALLLGDADQSAATDAPSTAARQQNDKTRRVKL